MRLIVIALLLLSFLPTGKALSLVAISDVKKRFSLNENNIAAWSEDQCVFSVQLTDEAKKEFEALTHDNVGKPLEVYVGTLFVISPTIKAPVSSGIISLTGEEKICPELKKLLPSEKKITSK